MKFTTELPKGMVQWLKAQKNPVGIIMLALSEYRHKRALPLTCDDFKFGDMVQSNDEKYVVVGVQPNNGRHGSIVVYSDNSLIPTVFSPEELTIIKRSK